MAETNIQKAADFARTSEIYFVEHFQKDIHVLMEVLGLTRKIEKRPGQTIKTYTVTGELADGAVGEGEDIPLSKYKTEVADVFELTVKKWRKQTTLEAINDKGYEQAVIDTDDAMRRDIQNGIRKDFFEFLKSGTATAAGNSLQATLADCWGELKVLFEDYSIEDTGFIYMVNPKDISGFLGDKDVTVQTAFGMTYVEKFLGLYDVLSYSGVPQGKVYATAKNNIILYYTNPTNADIAKAFEFTTDETGLVGVHHDSTYRNLTTETVAICGCKLFAELIDHLIVATIGGTQAAKSAKA